MCKRFRPFGAPWMTISPTHQLEFYIKIRAKFPILWLGENPYKANMITFSDYLHWYDKQYPNNPRHGQLEDCFECSLLACIVLRAIAVVHPRGQQQTNQHASSSAQQDGMYGCGGLLHSSVRGTMPSYKNASYEALCREANLYLCVKTLQLPRASQLLRRLGPNWHAPGHGDLPLVVPQNRPKRGRGKQRPTVLEALALKVPSHGPKVDLTVIAPWEVPNWAAQTSHWGVTSPAERKEWVQSLYEIGLNSSTEVVFTSAKVTERDVGDLTMVGGAALVSCRGGREPKSLK